MNYVNEGERGTYCVPRSLPLAVFSLFFIFLVLFMAVLFSYFCFLFAWVFFSLKLHFLFSPCLSSLLPPLSGLPGTVIKCPTRFIPLLRRTRNYHKVSPDFVREAIKFLPVLMRCGFIFKEGLLLKVSLFLWIVFQVICGKWKKLFCIDYRSCFVRNDISLSSQITNKKVR